MSTRVSTSSTPLPPLAAKRAPKKMAEKPSTRPPLLNEADAPSPTLERPSTTKSDRRGIQSIEIGFTILDALCRAGGPIPLSKIAEQANLTAANTHYYLVSFQRVGVVQQDSDTGYYGLGAYALKLGVAALEQFDIYKLARPAMVDISTRTGHTVFLGVWGNKGPAIVHRVEGGKSLPLLELRVGSVLPLLSSALGRNFLAHLPASVTARMVEEELSFQATGHASPRTDVPKSPDAVEHLVSGIREQGFSRCQDTLLPNFTSLSVPIFDLSGSIIAALTIMGPSYLLHADSETEVLSLLRMHATEISQTAGIYS